jgi:uncharacterized membrane protein YeaQ/YmgE (transglycosylase-associated protein family)
MACVIIISIGSSLFSQWLDWSPSQLVTYSNELLQSSTLPEGAIGAIITTIIGAFLFIVLAGFVLKKKELST